MYLGINTGSTGASYDYAKKAYLQPGKLDRLFGVEDNKNRSAEEVKPDPADHVLSMTVSRDEALSLTQSVQMSILSRPASISLRVHSFRTASLLGSTYV